MKVMRVWCQDHSDGQVFCDRFEFTPHAFKTTAMMVDAIHRMYEREAPHVEITSIKQIRAFEQDV